MKNVENALNIWLVQIGEPLPLVKGVRRQRLSMLSEMLARKGHKVTRWASSFDHLTKKKVFFDEEIKCSDNLTVKFLNGIGYKKNISIRRYLDHKILARDFITKARKQEKPDVILVATPPHNMAYSVVNFAKANNIPVIVDIRDQWPDIFFEKLSPGMKKVAKGVFCYEFIQIKNALTRADALTGVVKDFLMWGLESAGRDKLECDKVFYIGTNLADDVSESAVRPEIKELVRRMSGKFVVTYMGSFGELQHPLALVQAAKKISRESSDIFFVIGGDGKYMDEVRTEAAGLTNSAITGWLTHEEIMYVLRNSHVGVCPLNQDIPLFPNKVFMYFSAFLPVISSAGGELRDLMKDRGVGLYFKPNDVDGLSRNINKLFQDKDLLVEMSENVRKSFYEIFDADRIYEDFVTHIENISRIEKRQ